MVIFGLRRRRVCASAFTYVYGAITNGGVGCRDMPEAPTRVRTSVKKIIIFTDQFMVIHPTGKLTSGFS